MSTPLSVGEILKGQLDALTWQFRSIISEPHKPARWRSLFAYFGICRTSPTG